MRLAVISDLLEERWLSMDLLADVLLEHAAERPAVQVRRVRPALPARLRELAVASPPSVPGTPSRKAAIAFGRFVQYPLHLLAHRPDFDCYHVVDHSYAHLLFGLPARRSGIFCHDIDAFRAILPGVSGKQSHRALATVLLAGMRRASLVFHSTLAVRDEMLEHRFVHAERLRHVPYGVASEFHASAGAGEAAADPSAPVVLHVGNLIPRKNPDFVLGLALELCRKRADVRFLQIGGRWSAAQRERLGESGVGDRVQQIERLTRAELAPHYRSAAAVVLPSLAEGFGLPVVEALACGAPVVVSDIPVLTQVGAEAVLARPNHDLPAFVDAVLDAIDGRGPSRDVRLTVASRYSWRSHAAAIMDAYRSL